MDYVISDTHFGHANIIKHCERGFKSLDQMNFFMIQAWNSVVTERDTVYHLGDFAWKLDVARPLLYMLKGKIVLMYGNHDNRWLKQRRGVWVFKDGEELPGHITIKDVHKYKADKKQVWMSHYPHLSWPNKFHGAYHLFGHEHGNLEWVPKKSMDVGVDCIGYKPVLISEILNQLDNESSN